MMQALDIVKNYTGYKEEVWTNMKKRSGTNFRGYLYAEYGELVEKFGEPHSLGENNHKKIIRNGLSTRRME